MPRKKQPVFKLFLGYAPGVGKTFNMVSEGIRRHSRAEGVVIGVVETHGRAGIAELAPYRASGAHGSADRCGVVCAVYRCRCRRGPGGSKKPGAKLTICRKSWRQSDSIEGKERRRRGRQNCKRAPHHPGFFGRSAQKGWKRNLYLSAIHKFLRDAPPFDAHIVTHEMT